MALVQSVEATRDSFFKLPKVKVEKRLQVKTDRKDFMNYILKYNDERGLSREGVVDTAFILIVGGSETTATLLCGLTYYVLSTPGVLEKLQKEVHGTFSADTDIRRLTLNRLPYLDAVVEEALRMYPPASSIFPRRNPIGGGTIDGHYVPSDIFVGVHLFATYRSAKNFVDSDSFVPERWTKDGPEKYQDENKAAFHPFHLGPRGCIGKNLAYFEINSTITSLVWNFDTELREESNTWINQSVFLIWEQGPLWVNLRKRQFDDAS